MLKIIINLKMSNWDYLIFQKINSAAGSMRWCDQVMVFLAEYLMYILLVAGLIYLFFAYQKQLKALIVAAAAIILSRGFITEIIRFFYYRPRPFLTHPVNQLLTHDISGSFPSGHMTFIFPLIALVYLKNKKLGVVFMVLGVLMGLARIYCGVHYPSDIFAGIIIGVFCGWFVEKIATKNLK